MNDIVAVTAKADIQNMTKQSAPERNCATLCKSDTSPSCRQLNATNSGSVEVGRSIALLLGKQSPIIAKEDIVKLTGDPSRESDTKSNICLRSDVVFEGTQAYNVGMIEDCQIQVSSAAFGTLEIDIPRTVSFAHTASTGGNFNVLFQFEQAAPKLTFSNPTYQSYLGGNVLAAGYASGKFWFESAKHSCFAVKVN